jgi:hypothetical protein
MINGLLFSLCFSRLFSPLRLRARSVGLTGEKLVGLRTGGGTGSSHLSTRANLGQFSTLLFLSTVGHVSLMERAQARAVVALDKVWRWQSPAAHCTATSARSGAGPLQEEDEKFCLRSMGLFLLRVGHRASPRHKNNCHIPISKR